MKQRPTNQTLIRLSVAWDVIIGIATLQALVFFGRPFDVMGSSVDMRFMLVFAALGVLGMVLLSLAAHGRIHAAWAITPFIPSAYLSLYWGQMLLSPDAFSIQALVMLGFPIVAYTGGLVVSIYTTIKQVQLKR